jgi:CelD/BcsL family acetyltransferase involved in cellulose biosynthesis
LVAAQDAQHVVDAWLDTLKSGASPKFWTIANLDMDGSAKAAIDFGAAARGLAVRVVAPYPSVHLTRLPDGFEAHKAEIIARRRLKDIERNLRRLQDMGEVTLERVAEPARVRARLEQFLAMEQAGWKGARGTAFLSKKKDAAFARRAFGGGGDEEGLASIDSLLLDGTPIAMSINIATGGTAFTPKCTYDERLRRQSPGLVLEYLVIERFYASSDFDDMNAATTTGDHVVLGLWNDQRRMGRLIVGPDDWRTELFAGAWEAAYNGKQRLKKLLRR